MRKHRAENKQANATIASKKHQTTTDSTFDTSSRLLGVDLPVTKGRTLKIASRTSITPIEHLFQPKQDQPSEQFRVDHQLLQILRMSDEIAIGSTLNGILKLNSVTKPEKQDSSVLYLKFHKLFDLYIKEQILKHYCMKSGWKIEKKFLQKIVIPTFDILAINKDKLSFMFEPFLKELTCKYILKTEVDTFSRLSSQCLLIEITQIWLRIKQAEIELKRAIRQDYNYFKYNLCKYQDEKLKLDRKALFDALFTDSKDICMVNLIKIYIFCYKAQGEDNADSLEDWIEQY